MRRDGWFVIVGKWNGAPVRVHLLSPLVAVIMPGHAPTLGTVLGLFAIVLAHELGHAILVRRFGGTVERIDVLPWGGECAHSGVSSELHHSMIAWGGVLAQFLVMVLAQLYLWTSTPQTAFAADFLWAITLANLILAAFNLLPFRPLDGARAWRIVVLGPRALFTQKSGEVSLEGRFKRWRSRRHLRVVKGRKDLGPPN